MMFWYLDVEACTKKVKANQTFRIRSLSQGDGRARLRTLHRKTLRGKLLWDIVNGSKSFQQSNNIIWIKRCTLSARWGAHEDMKAPLIFLLRDSRQMQDGRLYVGRRALQREGAFCLVALNEHLGVAVESFHLEFMTVGISRMIAA